MLYFILKRDIKFNFLPVWYLWQNKEDVKQKLAVSKNMTWDYSSDKTFIFLMFSTYYSHVMQILKMLIKLCSRDYILFKVIKPFHYVIFAG